MAQVNKWIDADLEAGKLASPLKGAVGDLYAQVDTFEVAASDDDGSVYKFARIPANSVLVKAEINSDAITAGTDWDLGLYEEDETTEADKDLFLDGGDLSGGHANGSELNGMSALNIDAIGKKIWEQLGKTLVNKKEAYILALTANTVGSAAGTVTIRTWWAQG